MRLSYIRITAFRGIADLALDLGELTLLIGENGCSKGAVIDALELCLSPTFGDSPAFSLEDFPRGGGTPEIRLTFVETKPDEFDAIAGGIPKEARIVDRDGRRTFTLSVRAAKAKTRGRATAIAFAAADGLLAGDAAGAWAYVRRICPALAIAQPEANRHSGRGAGRGDAELNELIEHYHHIRETGAGLSEEQAARARVLFDRFAATLGARASAPPETRDVEDLAEVARPSTVWWGAGQGDPYLHAMGAVTLIGMILAARGPRPLDPAATPIILARCPEGWLHPILASRVWAALRSLAAQVVAVTYSGDLVSRVPLRSLRRIVRTPGAGGLRVFAIGSRDLSTDQMRRVTYHIRLNRGPHLFARCWLLVEGETETWLLPELAARLGISLPAEGVSCIEFAQCGLDAVIRLADILGIQWHLLCDGDRAGDSYADAARRRLARRRADAHISRLREPDIEHAFWHAGYAPVFLKLARLSGDARDHRPSQVIRKALKDTGKPNTALHLLERALKPRSPGVPLQLRQAIEQAVALARAGAERSK